MKFASLCLLTTISYIAWTPLTARTSENPSAQIQQPQFKNSKRKHSKMTHSEALEAIKKMRLAIENLTNENKVEDNQPILKYCLASLERWEKIIQQISQEKENFSKYTWNAQEFEKIAKKFSQLQPPKNKLLYPEQQFVILKKRLHDIQEIVKRIPDAERNKVFVSTLLDCVSQLLDILENNKEKNIRFDYLIKRGLKMIHKAELIILKVSKPSEK